METIIERQFNPYDQEAQMAWRAIRQFFEGWDVEIINTTDGDGWGNGGRILANEAARRRWEGLRTSSAHKMMYDVLLSNPAYRLHKWQKADGTPVQSVERMAQAEVDGIVGKAVEVFRVEYPYTSYDFRDFGNSRYAVSARTLGAEEYPEVVDFYEA